ncbi:serine/threonine protein kinase [Hyalangium minutum]|uniref:Serine/threonine protein kinase n=1 Tax=Hyalangium minutum TaxID=394096 RepID=A0A085WT01_9BACT|nr:serine/threonine-protein kinase [Hyalangium minutum]KFE70814.1 Serine/threonine protein kinase [Hyalangium minutum]
MIGAMELQPGTRVDGWQIIRALRTGGFGAVHHAEQHGKACALKVALHREQSGDTGKTHARALREVALLLTLDHPHIIKPRGYGYLPDGRAFCVLEYVDGWTLGDWLERTHPTFRELASVFAQLAGAVEYMHARGVLHRDLKLSNVMIRRTGEPVLIDLGCATSPNADELTATPLPPGTERYRSPEAHAFLSKQGRKPGARYPFKVADELFAVGVMLYELLTEPLPTKAKAHAGLADPVGLPASRTVNPRVPPALSALVEDLLARNPALRPESFEALQRRLAELAHHPGPEYAAEVHLPSAQRQPSPVDAVQAVGLAASERQGWRKVLALADQQAARLRSWLQPHGLSGLEAASRPHGRKPLALVGAVVMAVVAATWLTQGERPPPAPARREATAPTIPAAPALPPEDTLPVSAPALTAAPKEGSTVKPQPSDDLPSSRTARAPKSAPAPGSPGFAAWCKTLPLAMALSHGCASVPFKAELLECPPGSIQAMKKLGWDLGRDRFIVRLDERGPDRGAFTFTLGAPIIGVVPDSAPGQVKAPPGTLFYGRAYINDEGREDSPLGILRIVYDHVEFPGQRKYPVCAVSGLNPIEALKDGTATAFANSTVMPLERWNPQAMRQ